MSSSDDDDDIYNVRSLMKKRKTQELKQRKIKRAGKSQEKRKISEGFDEILDKCDNILSGDREEDVLTDIDDMDLPIMEQIRRKNIKRNEQANQRRISSGIPAKIHEPDIVTLTSSDDDYDARGKINSASANKRICENEISHGSDDNASTSTSSVKKPRSVLPEISSSDEEEEALPVRYQITDYAGTYLATFFFPANRKVIETREKFEHKLREKLPYLYFFTKDGSNFNPNRTPRELQWNLDDICTIRVRQSGERCFHMFEEDEQKAVEDDKKRKELENTFFQVKFQLKDIQRPYIKVINPAAPFVDIKTDFCREHNMDPAKYYLLFDNEKLPDQANPTDYDMEKNDVIDVHAI